MKLSEIKQLSEIAPPFEKFKKGVRCKVKKTGQEVEVINQNDIGLVFTKTDDATKVSSTAKTVYAKGYQEYMPRELEKLSEGDVITNSFGKKVHNPKIDIPTGYERFELDQKEGSNVAKIIGITGTSRKVISTAHVDLARELVKIYNSGGYGDSELKPLSGIQAWGSEEMVALEAMKIKFAEKPSDWSDFENNGFAAKYTIHEIQLKKIEKTIGHLKTYSGKEVFGTHFPRGPLVNVKKMPNENVCIISLSTGKYLVDTTQANSYIRMWAKLAD